jgi:hypothetical protein
MAIIKRAKPELKEVRFERYEEVPNNYRPYGGIERYFPQPWHAGRFEAKREDFGFTDGIFVHISNAHYSKSTLPKSGYVIGKVADGRKGKQLVSYVLEGDEGYIELYNKLRAEAEKVFLNELNENLKRNHLYEYNAECEEYQYQVEIQNELGFHSIEEIHEVFNKAYMDSWSKTTFHLSREVSEGEFSNFLKLMGLKEKPQGAWYERYTQIEGGGDTWSYIVVTPSTH